MRTQVRLLIDRMKEKFTDDVYLELYADGSGFIRSCQRNSSGDIVEEFDGLGELATILETTHD